MDIDEIIDGDVSPEMQAIIDETLEKITAAIRKTESKLCVAAEGSFPWALIQMKAGKKVRRASHPDGLYWEIFNDQICTFQEGNGAAWLSGVSITDEDARATDWRLYGEEA